jgi:hypothetical protein
MTSFKKPPLTSAEKEKKAQEFINFVQENVASLEQKGNPYMVPKKENMKSVLFRMPESFKNDINEIVSRTGLSFNAVCLELLRPAIKKRLKELRED